MASSSRSQPYKNIFLQNTAIQSIDTMLLSIGMMLLALYHKPIQTA